jgi:hypothetical protein
LFLYNLSFSPMQARLAMALWAPTLSQRRRSRSALRLPVARVLAAHAVAAFRECNEREVPVSGPADRATLLVFAAAEDACLVQFGERAVSGRGRGVQ